MQGSGMTKEKIEYDVGSDNKFKDLEIPKTYLTQPQGN